MKSQNQEPTGSDLTQALHAYLQAETDAQARTILETHPELLSDPQAEAIWQQMLRDNSTVPQRITTRHKLWKRKRRQHARQTGEPSTEAEPVQAKDEIQWQPISKLSDLAGLIDGMYADDQEQYTLYQEAREKPHVMDDATVQRAVRLYVDRLALLKTAFAPQFTRWQAEGLTDAQRQEVERLVGKTADLHALDEKIMALLKEIEKGTIDAIMRKSDFELGVEALYGKTPLTDQHNQLAQKIDTWVTGIEQRGGDDEQILEGMVDYMPTFKHLMDSTTQDQMDKLCALYPGFYRFARLLEDLARGIQDGIIDVPR